MPARSHQASSFFRLPCQVLAFRNLRLLTRPPGAALLPQDEWKGAGGTAPKIFFLGESCSLRQTSSGRDAMAGVDPVEVGLVASWDTRDLSQGAATCGAAAHCRPLGC